MTKKHIDLKDNDQVVFKRYCDIYKKEVFDYGNVTRVDPERKLVFIVYLIGYRCYNDAVPFEKVIAVYDESGEEMKFDNIVGKSILLECDE